MNKNDNPGCICGVTCAVEQCRYHGAGNCCTASHIDVKNEKAVSQGETFCGTFKCSDNWNCV